MLFRRLPRLLLHWPRYLPYHRARLSACQEFLGNELEVIGFAITTTDQIYSLIEGQPQQHKFCHTVFHDRPLPSIPRNELINGIWQELDRLHPDAIAINGYGTDDSLTCLLWCHQNKKPAIVMSDTWGADFHRRRWREFLKSLIVRQFSAAFVAGSRQRAYIESLGFPSERIFHGYDAIDNSHFAEGAQIARLQRDEILLKRGLPKRFFLSVGRFVTRKNFGRLIEAYSAYRHKAGAQARDLVVLGDGPLKISLEEQARALNVAEHVHLLGFEQYDRLPSIYGLADAFICPSLSDQWALVVNEAMATGLPVLVSTQCGAAADLLKDGINGFSFDPENVAAMATAMSKVPNSPEELQKMGQASSDLVEDFSLRNFAFSLRSAFTAAREPARQRSLSFLGKLCIELSIRMPLRRETFS